MPHTNILHYGAAGIAKRALGRDTEKERKIVYRWASEIRPSERPFPIHKIGRTIAAWESDIAAAAQHPANSTIKDDKSMSPRPPIDILPIQIREDVTVQIAGIPHDLTREEAEKIARVVLAMVASKVEIS